MLHGYPLDQETHARLMALTREISTKKSAGAILSGISQIGVVHLCGLLRDMEVAPLYAMAEFHFPECFKTMVLGPMLKQSVYGFAPRSSLETAAPKGPKGSVS